MSVGRSNHSSLGSGRLAAALAIAVVLPLVAGCPTEVPYGNGEGATAETPDEAPPFQDSPSQGDEQSSPEAGASSSAAETPELVASDPEGDPTDRYASTSPPASTGRLPWETDTDAQADDDPTGLFAGVRAENAPAEEPATPSEPQEEAAAATEGGDDFSDYFADAYAGLVDEEDKAAEPSQPTAEQPTEPAASAETAATPDAPFNAGDLWADAGASPDTASPNKAPPLEAPPIDNAPLEDPVFDTPPATAIEPKPPTTTQTAEADSFDDLWGDLPGAPAEEPGAEEPTAQAEPPPAADPEPSTAEQLPFGEPDEPLFADEPPAVEPKPEPITPEPLPEPPSRRVASAAPARRSAPMAAAAIDPLPAVPVLTFNTRHLAWLLGGKLGLAELADLEGATPTEVAEWKHEVERLSESLGIDDPSTPGELSSDPAERVSSMMNAAARAGSVLSRAHGPDHAALLEIALKTNALLVVADEHPELAGPVANAVRDAADRALLPRFLWEDAVRVLSDQPTADETHKAVVRLHQRVESFLR